MEKGEFELAQILLFPILKLVLSQPLFFVWNDLGDYFIYIQKLTLLFYVGQSVFPN
jgi:hypothetical protein